MPTRPTNLLPLLLSLICLAPTSETLLAEEANTAPITPSFSQQIRALPADQVKEWISQHGGEWCNTQRAYNLKRVFRPDMGTCPIEGPCDDPAMRDSLIPKVSDPIVTLRIKFNIFCADDGSSCAATQARADAQLATLNAHFLPLRIQWTARTSFINSTKYRIFTDDEYYGIKTTYADQPDSQLNVYVTTLETGYVGMGTFPWDPDALTSLGGILLDGSVFGANMGTLTHEIGHNLGLWHTFHGVSEVDLCGDCYERADKLNGDITGDFCLDTDPTPMNYYCKPPPGSDPCSGLSWGPTDPQNYMSYAPDACYTEFSPQQWGRIHCWINEKLNSWRNCHPELSLARTADNAIDTDHDGVPDSTDNCPMVFNPCQEDLNGNSLGDACDPDIDGDGIPNIADNCPYAFDPYLTNSDGDSLGDACDNCPYVTNANQSDMDNDGTGDSCDVCTDTDHDGYGSPGYAATTCPLDNCPDVANADQTDTDGDGVGDPCDNCPATFNSYQYDENSDGIGDACDGMFHIESYVLPDAFLGVSYSYQFWAVGGVPPYHWQYVSGDFPYGLSFNPDTVGTLIGIPNYMATFYFRVACADSDTPPSVDTLSISMRVVEAPVSPYICGDADGSGMVNIADVVRLIEYIFVGGLAPDPIAAGDADCDGRVDITDAVHLVGYIFGGEPGPCLCK